MSVTEQEFFDKTVTHFVTQGQPSMNSDRVCLYRGPEGRMCAVGVHIPDNVYVPRMEGTRINGLRSTYPELNNYIPEGSLAFEMQLLHDGVQNWYPDELYRRCLGIAHSYMLDTTVLNSLDFSKVHP